MESVVLSWWVLQLTGSPLIMGVIYAYSRISRWLGPLFGVVADRTDRRNLLILLKTVSTALYLIMALLAYMGTVQVWLIALIFTLSNVIVTFNTPVQTPLVQDIVGDKDLLTAMSLDAFAAADVAVFGAPIGGLLYDVVSVGGCYLVMSVASALSVIFLLVMDVKSVSKTSEKHLSFVRSLLEGLKYVWRDKTILAILTMTSLWNLLIASISTVLTPIIARDILDVGTAGFGMLMGAASLGQVLGALALSSMGNRNKGIITIFGAVMIGILEVAFSMSRLYPLSLALMILTGIARITFMTTTSTLLVSNVPRDMRGLVQGVRMQIGGGAMISFGSLITGALAAEAGAPAANGLLGAAFCASMLIIIVLTPKLRSLK